MWHVTAGGPPSAAPPPALPSDPPPPPRDGGGSRPRGGGGHRPAPGGVGSRWNVSPAPLPCLHWGTGLHGPDRTLRRLSGVPCLEALLPARCSIRSVTAAPGACRLARDLPPSFPPRLPPGPGVSLWPGAWQGTGCPRPVIAPRCGHSLFLTPAAAHVRARSPRAAGRVPEHFLREANRNDRLPPGM